MSRKIYNEIIMKWNDDTKSFDTLYEDSFEYDGPMMLLQGTCTGGVLPDCITYTFAGPDGYQDGCREEPWYCEDEGNYCGNSYDYCSDVTVAEVCQDPCTWEETITGCTDPSALNYDPDATDDDDSCEYDISRTISENEPITLSGLDSIDVEDCPAGGCYDCAEVNGDGPCLNYQWNISLQGNPLLQTYNVNGTEFTTESSIISDVSQITFTPTFIPHSNTQIVKIKLIVFDLGTGQSGENPEFSIQTNSSEIFIQVNSTNHAPVIDPIDWPNGSIREHSEVTIPVTVSDPDGDNLTWKHRIFSYTTQMTYNDYQCREEINNIFEYENQDYNLDHWCDDNNEGEGGCGGCDIEDCEGDGGIYKEWYERQWYIENISNSNNTNITFITPYLEDTECVYYTQIFVWDDDATTINMWSETGATYVGHPINVHSSYLPTAAITGNLTSEIVLFPPNSTSGIISGADSYDPDGYYISSYMWTLSDGPDDVSINTMSGGANMKIVTGINPEPYWYEPAETFQCDPVNINLTVTDDTGEEGTFTSPFHVMCVPQLRFGLINSDDGSSNITNFNFNEDEMFELPITIYLSTNNISCSNINNITLIPDSDVEFVISTTTFSSTSAPINACVATSTITPPEDYNDAGTLIFSADVVLPNDNNTLDSDYSITLSDSVNLTVNPMPDAPVFNSNYWVTIPGSPENSYVWSDDNNITVNEDFPFFIRVQASDVDNPAFLNITSAVAGEGIQGLTPDQEISAVLSNYEAIFTYTLNANYCNEGSENVDSITFTVSDPGDDADMSDEKTLNVTVNCVNDPPVAQITLVP